MMNKSNIINISLFGYDEVCTELIDLQEGITLNEKTMHN